MPDANNLDFNLDSNLISSPLSFGLFFQNTFMGTDHSIRESLLILATCIGYFNHMKSRTNNKSHIWIYLFFMLILSYLISYKTW